MYMKASYKYLALIWTNKCVISKGREKIKLIDSFYHFYITIRNYNEVTTPSQYRTSLSS